MNINDPKWIKRHLQLAKLVSTWSKDKSTKVGCVIVNERGLPLSWSYNGNPMGVLDTPERLERPLKYHYVAHAERNAIDLCRSSVENGYMFITHAPCSSCAIGIIQSGIKTVTVDSINGTSNGASYVHVNDKWKESVRHSQDMFREAEIIYQEYDEDTHTIIEGERLNVC